MSKRFLAFAILLATSLAISFFLYQHRFHPIAPTAPASRPQAATASSSCGTGSFTTSGGHRYCFIVNNSITTISQAATACQPYGSLASLINGETRQDVLDIISRFNQDKGTLYSGVSGGDPDDGAYLADSCNQITSHFPRPDTALYAENGNINCSVSALSMSRSSGKINDTREPNGRGAVCELAALPTPTPTPTARPTPTPPPSQQAAATPTPGGLLALAPTATPTPSPTAAPTPKVPVAGAGPSVLGISTIIGGAILLLLGLAL